MKLHTNLGDAIKQIKNTCVSEVLFYLHVLSVDCYVRNQQQPTTTSEKQQNLNYLKNATFYFF